MAKLCVAYIVVSGAPRTTDFVARFVSTWKQFPPLVNTDVLAICNGGAPNTEQAVMLNAIGAKVFVRSNVGWDIGAHIECSRGFLNSYDYVFFCGESVYFHREGWLKRLSDARERWGHGVFGVYGTNVVRGHLQTTAYASSPKLVAEYPLSVTDRASRYEYEHGERAFWRLVKRKYPVKLVTFDGEYDPQQWRMPENIIWKGTQQNCLCFSNHTDMYRDSDPKRKRMWQASADRKFI